MLWRIATYLIPAGIVGFWLVMMGILARRELGVERLGSAPAVPGTRDSWMGVYSLDKNGAETRVGFVHTESTPAARDGGAGTTFAITANLVTTLFSSPAEFYVTGTAWGSDSGGLAEFAFRFRSLDYTTRIGGKIRDGRLDLEITTGEFTFPMSMPVGRDLLLSGGMGTTTLNVPELRVGQEVVVDAFDPLSLAAGKARIRCIGEADVDGPEGAVRAKIVTTTLNSVTTKFWITDDQEIVRMETPVGFTFKKISKADALGALEPAGARGLLEAVAVSPSGKRPYRGAKRLEVRLSGLPSIVYPPSDATQREVDPGRFVIAVALSEDRTRLAPASVDASAFLESEPFIQAGHSKIRRQARRIAGDREGVWEAAVALLEWVGEHVADRSSLGFPSALDVLEGGTGGANEHAVLFTALARAAGVPARVVMGVVWGDDPPGFHYHAWPEVFDGEWIAVDPMLGQAPADATHLKLLTGNIERWPQLLPYLGQLNIEVLDVQ